MEDTKNNQAQQNADGCKCFMCRGGINGNGCGHRHFFLRLIIKLVILALVFWFGVKIGEFKSEFESEFGFDHHHMMMSPYGEQYGGQYPVMMRGEGLGGGYPMMQPQAVTSTAK